jgi:hypothetical protein
MSKIEYFTNMDKRKEIDKHLESIASLRSTLGTDSLVREKDEVQRKCNEHLRAIKDIDVDFYKMISLDK